jgi:hypothetical protein
MSVSIGQQRPLVYYLLLSALSTSQITHQKKVNTYCLVKDAGSNSTTDVQFFKKFQANN